LPAHIPTSAKSFLNAGSLRQIQGKTKTSGCSPDKKEEPGSSASFLGQITPLSQADKEKILAFKKELFDIEKISQKALTFVGNEIKLSGKTVKE
jgi:hypothetical protein